MAKNLTNDYDFFDDKPHQKKTKFRIKKKSNPRAEEKAIRRQRKAKQKMREDAYKMMNGEFDV